MSKKKVVVFDLDDTLYKEIDYLCSGYRAVADLVSKRFSYNASDVYNVMIMWYRAGEKNVFQRLNDEYRLDNPVSDYLNVYRYHQPKISMQYEDVETLGLLKEIGCVLGIISDGRSITQWNKIKALGLEDFIDKENVIISEEFGSKKPDERNYLFFETKYPGGEYWYVGDNPTKDFISPNKLGWETVMLKGKANIHKQDYITGDNEKSAKYVVDSLSVIPTIIKLL